MDGKLDKNEAYEMFGLKMDHIRGDKHERWIEELRSKVKLMEEKVDKLQDITTSG